jgi:hypothetical protein
LTFRLSAFDFWLLAFGVWLTAYGLGPAIEHITPLQKTIAMQKSQIK